MTSRRYIAALSLLTAIGMTSVVASGARAAESNDVLKLVPADAWGFVLIRSLETVDQRAGQLIEILGLDLPSPVTPMALGMLGVGDTIDMKRPLCLVMMDVQKFGGAGGPGSAAVLMVPARDPKAMLQKFAPPPAAAEDESEDSDEDAGGKDEVSAEGIEKISLMGEDSYAAIMGKYVVVGQNEDCVTHVLKTKKTLGAGFAEARLKALAKSDIYLSFSLRAVLTAYKDMVSMMLPMATAAFDPSGKSAEQLIDMLMQMQAVDVSLSLQKDGFAMSFLTVPKEGSDLEKAMKGTKNVSGSLLTVLPKERYLIAFGATNTFDTELSQFGEENMFASFLKTAQGEGADEEAAKAFAEATKAIDAECRNLVKSIKSMAACVSALPQGTDGMVGVTLAVETSSAKAFLTSARKVYEAVWKLSDDEDVATVKEQVTHAEDAETISGRPVDTVTVKLGGLAEVAEMDTEDLNHLQAVLGKEWVFRFGAVDDKHFLFSFGGGKARFAKASEALTSKSGASLADDEGIGALSKKLHSPRATEAYLAADNIIHFAKAVAKTVGHEDEIPFDLPTLNAPIALGGAQIGGIQQADLFVPMKLITAIKKTVDEMTKAEMQNFDEDEDDDEEDGAPAADDDD